MAIYAIGDLHLSLSGDKPMDVFPGWENYTERIAENWNKIIKASDTVVLAGDISWGMTLEGAKRDFAFIDALPGRKLLLKGNHDYWWSSAAKMQSFFHESGFETLGILHNNSYAVCGINICGSRGWLFENGQEHDDKIIRREAIRIEASIKSVENPALETVLFLHYPPIYADQCLEAFLVLMRENGIKRCFYGHIHGAGHRSATRGVARGIDFRMISADYLAFEPLLVQPDSVE